MRVIDANGNVIWDSADPMAGPVPPQRPEGGQNVYLNMSGPVKPKPPAKSAIDFMDFQDGGEAWNRVVTDPRNIRSRFARFDPRLAHLKNLSAGLAGAAVLPLFDPYGEGQQ